MTLPEDCTTGLMAVGASTKLLDVKAGQSTRVSRPQAFYFSENPYETQFSLMFNFQEAVLENVKLSS